VRPTRVECGEKPRFVRRDFCIHQPKDPRLRIQNRGVALKKGAVGRKGLDVYGRSTPLPRCLDCWRPLQLTVPSDGSVLLAFLAGWSGRSSCVSGRDADSRRCLRAVRAGNLRRQSNSRQLSGLSDGQVRFRCRSESLRGLWYGQVRFRCRSESLRGLWYVRRRSVPRRLRGWVRGHVRTVSAWDLQRDVRARTMGRCVSGLSGRHAPDQRRCSRLPRLRRRKVRPHGAHGVFPLPIRQIRQIPGIC
jgi:hypothetical protein